jgi:hypothetical protein
LAVEVGKPGQTLRGIAGDGTRMFAARSDGATTELESRHGTVLDWHVAVPGSAGPIATTGDAVIVTLSSAAATKAAWAVPPGAPLAIRGEPGAAIAAVDAKSGTAAWRLAFDATEWAVITSIAADASGVVIGGTFSGTLRAATTVVSSAGKSDGFVARLSPTGTLAWLVRIGGPGADAVQGVATRADRTAVAGTFTAGADVRGTPLQPFDEKSPFGDGFVAELDVTGARLWSQSFGGKRDDTVAGVAIDTKGRVAVAATIRDAVRVGTNEVTAHGPSAGLVFWLSPTGEVGATTLLGGSDFDGLRAIAAVDDRVVVGGFFTGTLPLGKHAITAIGGDDAFLATINAAGDIESTWQVGGPGREEITALATVPGGFLAGITHSAAVSIGDDRLPSPADPTGGAALLERPAP